MRTFFTVWSGQLVSTIGTGMTDFALAIWVYQLTGSVTQTAGIILAKTVPMLFVGPFAGALVDRWDRRIAMLLADFGAAIGTAVIAILFFTDSLQVWHIYVAVVIASSFESFQFPAFAATTTLLVPKEQLGRAGGLASLADAGGMLISPIAAGALMAFSDIGTVLILDLATFGIGVATLLVVRIPRPPQSKESEESKGSLMKEVFGGWAYVRARPGLLWLLGVFLAMNVALGFTNPLFTPMILSFTDELTLGTIFSVMGVGALLGSLFMSAWGGPKTKVYGVLAAGIVGGIAVVLVGMRPSAILVGAGGFALMFFVPIANASSQAIWQVKVAPDIQGRVFALRRTMASAFTPISVIAAGPLADYVFEPLLADDGGLAGSVGSVIGTGPGRGIGFMVMMSGALVFVVCIAALSAPKVRHIERDLPDAI